MQIENEPLLPPMRSPVSLCNGLLIGVNRKWLADVQTALSTQLEHGETSDFSSLCTLAPD
jgi:hypothetical protein